MRTMEEKRGKNTTSYRARENMYSLPLAAKRAKSHVSQMTLFGQIDNMDACSDWLRRVT